MNKKKNNKTEYSEPEKHLLDITISDDTEQSADLLQHDGADMPVDIEELAKVLKPLDDNAPEDRKDIKEIDIKKLALIFTAVILLAALGFTVYYILISQNKPISQENSLNIGVVSQPSSSSQTTIDADYNKNEYIPDIEKYSDTILPLTADAGVGYLDETLFIGDSNTQRLYGYGYLPLQNIIAAEGMGIESVVNENFVYFSGMTEPVTAAKAVSYLQPRRIIFNFGTNNASGNMSSEDFIFYYKAALDEIKSEYPYSDIILAAIYPVARQRSYNNISLKTIDEFNLAILEFAQQEGYKFLNTPEILKDERTGYIKDKYVIDDGLHLNENAYNDVLNYIRTHALITQDIRPAITAVPRRCMPPAPPESEAVSEDGGALTISISFTAQTQQDGTVIDEIGGSISGDLVQNLALGETGTAVVAQAYNGYKFGGWYIGTALISQQAQITYTIPGDVSQTEYVIKAVFIKKAQETVIPQQPVEESSSLQE